MIQRPKCPFCGVELISINIGYEQRDVSATHGDLRFIDIFYCRECGAVLNIEKSLKDELKA